MCREPLPSLSEGALRRRRWVMAAEEEVEAADFVAIKLLTLCSVAIDAAFYAWERQSALLP